jgi:hypothetical protein
MFGISTRFPYMPKFVQIDGFPLVSQPVAHCINRPWHKLRDKEESKHAVEILAPVKTSAVMGKKNDKTCILKKAQAVIGYFEELRTSCRDPPSSQPS